MADMIDPIPAKPRRGRKPKAVLAPVTVNGADAGVVASKTTARKIAPRKAAARNATGPKIASLKTTSLKDTVVDAATTVRNTVTAKATTAASVARAKATSAVESVDWKGHAEDIKAKAEKTARSAADTAKDKTGSAMQGLSKLIADTAGTVDAKLGPQYGDYARYAAEAVAGAAKTLDAKDIDQLIGEARDFVRKSPAVAIGAAAVAGFVLMRLAKGSGSNSGTDEA
jgi:hypothetical protein